jgi:hypothetical protein
MEKHYILREPADDVVLAKALVHSVFGETVAWPTPEDVARERVVYPEWYTSTMRDIQGQGEEEAEHGVDDGAEEDAEDEVELPWWQNGDIFGVRKAGGQSGLEPWGLSYLLIASISRSLPLHFTARTRFPHSPSFSIAALTLTLSISLATSCFGDGAFRDPAGRDSADDRTTHRLGHAATSNTHRRRPRLRHSPCGEGQDREEGA